MPVDRVAPLLRREALGGPYFLLTFAHPEVARDGAPGQFVMLKAGRSPAPPLRRPFSIMATDPGAGTFTVFLKEVGPGTRSLCALDSGEEALCLGPLGNAFAPPTNGGDALLVAGGYGIAPFHLFTSQNPGARARVFYGGRTADDLQVRAPFAARGVPLVLATEDGTLGERGYVTLPLERHLDGAAGSPTLYACGPHGMLAAVAAIAARRRIPCFVSLDPWMGCGVGTCLSCVVKIRVGEKEKNRPACTAGPVFPGGDVLWRAS
jgi:dihydroorotate dehydrogenase electron transfer subunit